MTAQLTIYDELLSREYGALALRDIVGKNLMRAVVISSVILWTIFGVWHGVEYLRSLGQTESPPVIVIYDPVHPVLPPSLTDDPVKPVKIVVPNVKPPVKVVPRVVDDAQVTDTSQMMTVNDIKNRIDEGRTQVLPNGGEGNIIVVAPPADDPIPEPDKFIRVEHEPVIISAPAPEYPAALRNANVVGRVIVSYLVNKKGDVAQVKIEKASPANLGFEEATTKAVKEWKFKPAINNGQPVAVWVSRSFRFQLK